MKALLTCNLSDNTVRVGDEAWTPPVLTFAETLTLALRLERTVAGVAIEPALTIDSLQASLGPVDARPLAGGWALQIGSGAQTADNTTDQVPYKATTKELQTAINEKTAVTGVYGTATVRERDGSWWIVFANAVAAVPLKVRDNTLFPLTFGQVNAVEIDGVWHHEVRLIQLPVDSTSSSARILPAAPVITEIQLGGKTEEFEWNEIQRLVVNPDFRATYYLQFGYARTAHLSKDDGPEEVLAALAAVLGNNFTTTLATDFTIDIEFTGAYAGAAQPLITAVPVAPPPGDLTFSLPLDRAALLVWLRAAPFVTLPLEVKVGVTETIAGDDVTSVLVPLRTTLTIQRPLNWAELEENPNVDWLRPPSPKDYIPRSSSTVFTGDKSQASVVGDGVATEFAVTHPFATVDVFVFAHENITNGRQLVEGADYTVVINSTGEVTVTALGDPPASNAWTVYVRAMEPIAAFAEDLEITIGQVIGLEARLESLETAVEDLQTLLPTGTLVRPAEVAAVDTIEVPDTFIVYPNARLAADFDPASAATLTPHAARIFPTIAVRPPGLLPAIRDTSIADVSALPGSPSAGDGIRNTGSDPILIPGGLGRRGRYLAVGEFAGYDGRVWYHLTRGTVPGSSTTYFPSDFEQQLMEPLLFERDTWRAGQKFLLEFDLVLAAIRANTNVQWVLVIEQGTMPTLTDPTVAAIDITTAGTGTHKALLNGTVLGTFTADATTNVITLAAHGRANGDVLQLSNTGGGLPGGLAAATDYVVRDVTTDTFKLAAITTSLNLRDVEWNATPILMQRLVASGLRQTRHFGCRILRSTANVMTAEALKSGAWEAAGSCPLTAQFAVRVRLIDFDTENSIAGATGYAFAGLTAAKAQTA